MASDSNADTGPHLSAPPRRMSFEEFIRREWLRAERLPAVLTVLREWGLA